MPSESEFSPSVVARPAFPRCRYSSVAAGEMVSPVSPSLALLSVLSLRQLSGAAAPHQRAPVYPEGPEGPEGPEAPEGPLTGGKVNRAECPPGPV